VAAGAVTSPVLSMLPTGQKMISSQRKSFVENAKRAEAS
jgi:hypothetical protein